MDLKQLSFLLFQSANYYEEKAKVQNKKTQKEFITTCGQLRATANQVLEDTYSITDLNILDKNLPLELAQLLMDALLSDTEDVNFSLAPDFYQHVFIVGKRMLLVHGDEPIENTYAYYLWDLYHDLTDYLATYVGQESLKTAATRIAEPLLEELAETLEIEDDIESN